MVTLDSLQTALNAQDNRLKALEEALKTKADLGTDGTVLLKEIPFVAPAEAASFLAAMAALATSPIVASVPVLPATNLLPLAAVALLTAGISQTVRIPLHLSAGKYKLLLTATKLTGSPISVLFTDPNGAWIGNTKLSEGANTLVFTLPVTADYQLVFDAGYNGTSSIVFPVLTPVV